MSDDRGEIHVIGFSINQERPARYCYGRSREPYVDRASDTRTTARLDLEMDRAGLARFLDLMEQVAPGFRRQHTTSASALPETTRALPRGPIDAEFVDD